MAKDRSLNLSRQFRAALDALAAIATLGRPACVIGGLAVQRWGEPRFTQDADLTVFTPFGGETDVIDPLLARFEKRRPDARQHALTYRVLLLRAANGISLDISLAGTPFEEDVLARATTWRTIEGTDLITCSAEDLILYKLVAGRPGDIQDVIGVVRRQHARLDVGRVREFGALFAELKEDPSLLQPFEDALRRASGSRPT
ncbi:MAG TPA: hypothetical protein VGD94_02270 [Vicinamibacterales bacterium]